MTRLRGLAVGLAIALVLASSVPARAASLSMAEVWSQLKALPYQPAYVAAGIDTGVDAPDQPALADLAPHFPAWPAAFQRVQFASIDGAPLYGHLAVRTDGVARPGVVVMHGFNSNGKSSVVRYAAMLYANGYQVFAPDFRDMGDSRSLDRDPSSCSALGCNYSNARLSHHYQTFGWKEAEDLYAAALYLKRQPKVSRVGLMGFSEGAQNAILAAAMDRRAGTGAVHAVLSFSPPADQGTQLQADPAVTAALVSVVVSPYTDACAYLLDASRGNGGTFGGYGLSVTEILARQRAYLDVLAVDVPVLAVFANDDALVAPDQARLLASRTNWMKNAQTWLLTTGNHAYYYDRWFQDMVALTYFRYWLGDARGSVTAEPTVMRTPGGAPAGEQTIDLSDVTPADGDAIVREACR